MKMVVALFIPSLIIAASLLSYFLSFFLFLSILLGTPATVSQMAKDVTTFLRWTAGKTYTGA